MEYFIATANNFCDVLEQLNSSEPDINNRANKAAKLIKNTLENFRTKIRKEGFRSTEDEIHFFKYVKPKISSYLIFYSVLAEIETCKITLNDEELKLFIDKKERKFRHVMRENIDFVKYYNAGLCHLDNIYFVREANVLSMSKNSTHQLADPEFNASHDMVAANIMAFELFKKHVAQKPDLQANYGPPVPKLKWTASKSDFIELVYALQATTAINYGENEIKEIFSALQSVFHVHIDDPYRIFIDLANRKTAPLKFIPKLEEGFLRKVDEIDGMM
jgi:hypothetical protein